MCILVVDDEAVVLDVIVEYFAEHGLAAWTARSVDEALEAVGRVPVRLVLSDIRMAPRDGYALLEELRRTNPEIPVVLMSSFAPAGASEEALRSGAAGFLRKPFSQRQLLDAVAAAFAARGTRCRQSLPG